MKKHDSECSLSRGDRGQRPVRVLTESISSEEGPDTERLLASQLSAAVVAAASARRQSLTAPPSPTDSRKKHHHRHHNYMNHLQQLIHWRDIWGGEPHKGQEVQRLMICSKCYNQCRITRFLTLYLGALVFVHDFCVSIRLLYILNLAIQFPLLCDYCILSSFQISFLYIFPFFGVD